MHPVPSRCPVCQEAMTVTRLHCPNCGTGVDGRFSLGAFDRLTPEQEAELKRFTAEKNPKACVQTHDKRHHSCYRAHGFI